MASSDYDTYCKLLAKNLFFDESGIKFHDANDDSKTATLKVSALGAGNVDLTLPTSANGALLSDHSNDSEDLEFKKNDQTLFKIQE